MKLTDNIIKKWSTWANFVSLTLGAAMVYLPNLLPSEHHAQVMCVCSVVIAACQFIKQGNLEKLKDD